MVRLCRIRVLRQRHRQAVLPAVEPRGAATADVWRLRAGVPGAAVRQPGPWPRWRPHRPAGAADAVDRHDGRCDAHHGPAPHLRTGRSGRSRAAHDHARHPGLLAGRGVHRLDGVHDRAGIAHDAGSRQQFDGGRNHDWIHPRIPIGLARQPHAQRRRRRQLGLARPVHRERVVVHLRVAAAAGHPRDGRRGEGRRDADAPHPFASGRLAADCAHVRNRRNDERRVLPDFHVCRRTSEESQRRRWRNLPPREYVEPAGRSRSRSRSAAGCRTASAAGG